MNRKEIDKLIYWKSKEDRKPLIINGARQVGKTWLMLEFGKLYYESIIYLNFEANEKLIKIFEAEFDIPKIIKSIEAATSSEIQPGNSLLIFDEIQMAPRAITCLKYFNEKANEYHVIAAGSLLGLSVHQNTSFPVGKVEFLDLYPLNFIEFLEAINEDKISKLIIDRDFDVLSNLESKIKELLRLYFFVGGMPKAILTYIVSKDLSKVREIHNEILRTYEYDFSKHAPNNIVPRIRMLWNAIPSQLAKENKKFIYGAIKSGARAKDYELALAWLIDAGLVYKIHNVSSPKIPLKIYEETGMFKLYIVDVGLLGAKVESNPILVLTSNSIFQEFKGSLTEQYVLQQLKSKSNGSIYYWSSPNARSEVDFIFESNAYTWPLEVKAEENLQSKSLKVFTDKFNPRFALRTSMSTYRVGEKIINIPLYAIGIVYDLISDL